MMRVLYIIRGAQGSGKSTIAEALANWLYEEKGKWVYHFEADNYFINKDTGKYEFKLENLQKAHKWCYDMVEHAMSDKTDDVIVSNTFGNEGEVKAYRDLAKKYGYEIHETIIWQSPFKDVHGVPDEIVAKKRKQLHDSIRNRKD